MTLRSFCSKIAALTAPLLAISPASLLALLPAPQPAAQALAPHTLAYAPGHSITLSLPKPFAIEVAASGLRRVRFFAQAPDGRIFATGMWNLADNTRGSVYILSGWNPQTHRFTQVIHYLDHLRNPNNLTFWTDPATHQTWLYLPLTDRLVRFRYQPGDTSPSSPPETLIRFPDYGLNYKYGGWHLTRTVAIANLHGRTQVYVAVGSSCDYCKEREAARASILQMDPDGKHQRIGAYGVRNAVDLRYVPDLDGGALFATDMGDDHLGDRAPEDTFFELDSPKHLFPLGGNLTPDGQSPCGAGAAGGASLCVTVPPQHYGWPTCYFAQGRPTLDTTPLPDVPPPGDPATQAERPASGSESSYGAQPGLYTQGTLLPAGGNAGSVDPNANLGPVPAPLTTCGAVPPAYNTFPAHSSPLGLAFFGRDNSALRSSFLVAFHGASRPRIGTGYQVVRFTPTNRTPQPFVTGFLTTAGGQPRVQGRPCGLLRLGPDTFLLSDDRLGLVYYIHPHGG